MTAGEQRLLLPVHKGSRCVCIPGAIAPLLLIPK